MRNLLFLLSIISINLTSALSQYNWQWTALDTMPERISNNAVCEAEINGERFVYSFTGIDTSKIYSGINLKSFKYDISNDNWSVLPNVPDTMGKIAAAASFVQGKIYLMGGYHVLANGSEVSSNKVHIFNPVTNLWEADGANIPVAIDDQVQCVWRDSLIYLITGWSNNGNVPKVQIYNPQTNTWQLGEDTPNNNFYKAFGASGFIFEDTIYYHGGANGSVGFYARKYLRQGVINPENPTEIEWTQLEDPIGDPGYRSACSGKKDRVFWIGGSATAYNYNGIAYNGSGGVEPARRVLEFFPKTGNSFNYTLNPEPVMDLRGIADIGGGSWIIAGGMDTTQTVSNKTWLLHNPSLSGITDFLFPPYFEVTQNKDYFVVKTEFAGTVKIYDVAGRELYSEFKLLADSHIEKRSIRANMLVFVFNDGSNVPVTQKVVNVNE